MVVTPGKWSLILLIENDFEELQNKLITRCQNPRTVVNKYTHEPVLVSCGSCPSCILRRSGIQTNLLTTYSAQFRYIYFVTLAYAPRFLPTLLS